MLRPRRHEREAFFLPTAAVDAEDCSPTRAAVIAAALEQRPEEPGLAVDDATLERVADTVMDPGYRLPGLYYTAEEAADDVPEEVRERVDEYLEEQPGLSGGIRLGWQAGRRVLFARVVRDLDVHRQALHSIGGARVVVEPAARSEEELVALQERIWAEGDELRALGIDLASSAAQPEAETVEVEVVATQGEEYAAELLTRRYGPAVRVGGWSPAWRAERTRAFGSWSADGRRLAVFYPIDRNGEAAERCEVAERSDSVIVTVIITDQIAGCTTLIGGYHALTGEVTLTEPLGTRIVIDGSCDERRPSLAERRRAD